MMSALVRAILDVLKELDGWNSLISFKILDLAGIVKEFSLFDKFLITLGLPALKFPLTLHVLGRGFKAIFLEKCIHEFEVKSHPWRRVLQRLLLPGIKVVPAVGNRPAQYTSPGIGCAFSRKCVGAR